MTGTQRFKLRAEDAKEDQFFGFSTALGNTSAVIGAIGDEDHGRFSGAAYVFDVVTGEQLLKLFPDDPIENSVFGFAVGLSGSTANIGSPWFSRSAFLFDVVRGEQLLKILSPEPDNLDVRFARSVGISGERVIVGAPDERSHVNGSAYVFEAATGRQLFRLSPGGESIRPRFGESVAIEGDIAIVGEFPNQQERNGIGAVDVFDLTSGQRLYQVTSPDPLAREFFGKSVDLSGDHFIVGAGHADNLGTSSGAAYLFDLVTGDRLATLTARDGGPGDEFGFSVALSDTHAVAGSWSHDVHGISSGATYIYEVPEPTSFALAVFAALAGLGRWLMASHTH